MYWIINKCFKCELKCNLLRAELTEFGEKCCWRLEWITVTNLSSSILSLNIYIRQNKWHPVSMYPSLSPFFLFLCSFIIISCMYKKRIGFKAAGKLDLSPGKVTGHLHPRLHIWVIKRSQFTICMSIDCEGKPEFPEKTHTRSGGTWKENEQDPSLLAGSNYTTFLFLELINSGNHTQSLLSYI